ncbi:MAG: tetratricopeptide repeat protein [Deltaproteobacteria bacterium]|nr:tetratricopeptide repeat protein [Deltaproteobacteria bacterium]
MSAEANRPGQAETRRLAAIMFTDIVGFSRQMGADEARTLRLLDTHNRVIQQAVATHHGAVIKIMGDAFLVDFPSVVHAVQCAQQIQTQFRAHNTEKQTTEQIHVRIGIHSGDIVQREGDVFGDGVNIAARLQALAEPDTICISDMVYRDVAKKIELGTIVSLGRPRLKNIAERFHIYALLPEAPRGIRQTLQVQRLRFSRRVRPASRALAVALLLLSGGLLAGRYFWRSPLSTQDSALRTPAALPLPDKPSIVVLPFANMSEDSKQDYFSDGITEDLTSSLSKISSLFVIARNSAFTYKGKAVKVQDVSQEMGVRYVLEGSVRKADNQVRITAQLIDATTGEHLWAERYDRPLTDIFALQDEVVQKIVTTLKLQLTLQEQGYLVHKTTDNLEAYDAYLRGRESSGRFTKEANAEARQLFERAVALDPAYAEAYARLGYTYYIEWGWQWSQDPQALERAGALAQQALALDDLLPIAHSLLSIVHARKQQYDQAITEGERAIALDPNNAESYAQQSNTLNFAGKPEEALRSIEQAIRFSPHYPVLYLFWLSWAYQLTGRYAEATVAYKQVLVRNPNFLAAHLNLAVSYVLQWASQLSQDPQTLEQAVAAAQRAIVLNDASFQSHAILGFVYLWQKQYEQAIAAMERAVALGSNDAISYAVLADGLSRIGRSEDALRATEQALHLRSSAMVAWHLLSVGAAYDLAGKPEEAVVPLKQYLSHYPNILGAHLALAAVYSELGKEAEAHAEVAEVLRINPKFSLEVHKERAPIKDPATLERHIAALQKAGLK